MSHISKTDPGEALDDAGLNKRDYVQSVTAVTAAAYVSRK